MAAEPASTVAQFLAQARAAGVDRLDALLLLGAVLDRDRSWLTAHQEYALTHEQQSTAAESLRRRADGVPLSHLLGRREFHGLMLKITPDVLDPRPDTETLVDWALELIGSAGSDGRMACGRIIDLGTGSGAVALAVKAARPHCQVHASDASAAALAVAKGNAQALGLALSLHLGSWWQAAPPGLRFDLALSNPPYIAEGDPHLPALAYEPRSALVSGADGLDDIRALVAGAPAHLAPGAWLLMEHGHDQAPAVAAVLRHAGWADISHRRDLAGHVRCTGARLAR